MSMRVFLLRRLKKNSASNIDTENRKTAGEFDACGHIVSAKRPEKDLACGNVLKLSPSPLCSKR